MRMERLALAVLLISAPAALACSIELSTTAPPRITAAPPPHHLTKLNDHLERLHAERVDLRRSPLLYGLPMDHYGQMWDRRYQVRLYRLQELARRTLRVERGLIHLANATEPLSTTSLRGRLDLGWRHALVGSKWLFVMSCAGEILVSPAGVHVRHSSLAKGVCVASAGWLRVRAGRIDYLDNFSGHYRPPLQTLARVIRQLHLAGVDVSGLKVRTIENRPEFLGIPIVGSFR